MDRECSGPCRGAVFQGWEDPGCLVRVSSLSSGLAGTANQGLVDALECQCRQREEIKPAGNVIGFFFSFVIVSS